MRRRATLSLRAPPWAYALVVAGLLHTGCGAQREVRGTPPRPMPAAEAPTRAVVAHEPAELADEVMYLVMVDRFDDGDGRAFEGLDRSSPLAFHGGDLRGLLRRLVYLHDLGVTTLWLTPLHLQVATPVAHEGRPHWPLHGYWPEDHEQLDPRFGDEEDLRAVLDEAHRLGLRVILDVVPNHYGYGARAASDPARVRSPHTGTCPPSEDERKVCLFGLPDLKTERPEVSGPLADTLSSWACRFPLDGFRFDAAKHVELELLAAIRRKATNCAQARGASRFLTVAEHWGSAPGDEVSDTYLRAGAADTLFDFEFSGLVEGFLSGRLRAEALAHHLEQREHQPGPPGVHFLSTHDTAPLTHRLRDAPARYRLAPFLQMTTFGVPLVTWGEELGRNGGDWPDNRRSMPWETLDTTEATKLRKLWTSLITLRRGEPALRARGLEVIHASTSVSGATVVYRRGQRWLVVVHRGEPSELVLRGIRPLANVSSCVDAGEWSAATWRADEGGVLSLSLPADAAAVLSIDEPYPASPVTTHPRGEGVCPNPRGA